jgi:4-hydroxy-2-oxoglutarate aldolase
MSFPRLLCGGQSVPQRPRHRDNGLDQKAALAEQAFKAGIATVKYAAALTMVNAAGIECANGQLRARRPYKKRSDEQKRSLETWIEQLRA